MEKTDRKYSEYIKILKTELVPAMGCTEPTSLAFGAAKAREVLGCIPNKIEVFASGNIIKNVKSVIIPHTCGQKGIEIAVLAGALYGNPDTGLQVIEGMTKEQSDSLKEKIKEIDVSVKALESNHILDFIIKVYSDSENAEVRIWDTHTNVALVKRNDEIVLDNTNNAIEDSEHIDYSLLNVEDIFDFANSVDLSEVEDIIKRQEEYNMRIANEGLTNDYGVKVGKILLSQNTDVRTKARAYASAASDARMGGCDLPVVINSGSGNQGITTSVPVIIYANEYKKSEEEKERALLVSNLVTLHLKEGIGRLSAYCGVVSAGAGAGAGIAYLLTKSLDAINHAIVNALGITSGIVCDGAKASCAAKIATAVESGIFGFEMYLNGCEFKAGDGLISKGVEKTIENISELGHDGMLETDKKIIEIMTE